jgi:hypothetical protein
VHAGHGGAVPQGVVGDHGHAAEFLGFLKPAFSRRVV